MTKNIDMKLTKGEEGFVIKKSTLYIKYETFTS